MQKYQSWEDPRCEILKALYKARPMSRKLCLTCKGGRLLCGRPSCPLLARVKIQSPLEGQLKEELFGPSPSIFVGWKGYPKVFIGPLTSLQTENSALLDDPSMWYGMGFNDIIRMRSLLVRSKLRQGVRARTKLVEESQEVALSITPVDTEVRFERKPSYGMSFTSISQPLGPSGILKDLKVADNPKIPKKVDSIIEDEFRASDATLELYRSGFDVYYLSRVLSSGALGVKENRKLVPTRWSITAIDDILGKGLTEEIRDLPEVTDYMVYRNTYLYNHFEVLLMPRKWEYEQFEAWAPDTLWTMAYDKPAINQENEGYWGRKDYALKEGGGYYACRLAVLEALQRMRRQAGVVVFREIYEGYVMPVGVWEVRENVRKAMANPPSKFASLEEALEDIAKGLKIPLKEYLDRSNILRQLRLEEFLKV
ncbi:MAG: Nre family DNA repair protein [Candidatus Hydrothermarchaeales archaeon]